MDVTEEAHLLIGTQMGRYGRCRDQGSSVDGQLQLPVAAGDPASGYFPPQFKPIVLSHANKPLLVGVAQRVPVGSF